jgi:hypothetical protein
VPYRVARRLCQIGGAGHATHMIVQPVMQGIYNQPTSFLALVSSVFGRPTSDLRFNRVEGSNTGQYFGGE